MSHMAVRAGYRLDEVKRMTIRQLVAVTRLEAEVEREDVKSTAIANRLAQADKRDWLKSMKELSDDRPRKRQEMVASSGEKVDPSKIAGNPFFEIPEE